MASATTAVSAAGSDLRKLWAAAAVLLLILFAAAWLLELGKSTRVVVDGPLRLPPLPASHNVLADEGLVDDAVQLTPAFVIEEPTTLELTLSRGPEEGWVGADLALIDEESGAIRQLGLGTDVRHALGTDVDAHRTSTALIDRVAPGRYVLRIAPSWEPLEDPTPGRAASESEAHPPTSAHLEVTEGRRSHFGLALAALSILVPPFFATGRLLVGRARRRDDG